VFLPGQHIIQGTAEHKPLDEVDVKPLAIAKVPQTIDALYRSQTLDKLSLFLGELARVNHGGFGLSAIVVPLL
jgi:hypothetical protein